MWRLQDRVLYRALVDRLKLKLPEDLQGRETHDEFERRPHQNPDNTYDDHFCMFTLFELLYSAFALVMNGPE